MCSPCSSAGYQPFVQVVTRQLLAEGSPVTEPAPARSRTLSGVSTASTLTEEPEPEPELTEPEPEAAVEEEVMGRSPPAEEPGGGCAIM